MKHRTIRKYFRVSPDELKELDRRAGHLRTSTFVRLCALGRPPLSVPSVNNELLVELRKIGTNLNQIARKLHTAPSSINLAEIAAEECQKFRNAIILWHTFDIETEEETA